MASRPAPHGDDISSRTIVLIPARLGSTRLPDKPLAEIAGAPMIVQVWRRACEAEVGPVVDERQLGKNLEYVEVGQKEGAKLVYGGERVKRETDGYFMSPAIFTERLVDESSTSSTWMRSVLWSSDAVRLSTALSRATNSRALNGLGK